ncbi:MAG TPA: winged helix-turn-helix domain-containing protein [Solirubrobacteraceae bacterium]|nr:winged helix-turn-helix domain-containing protein [Solirubrobacteraceae bacterium]
MLAELGFSPRRVSINGSLRPAGEPGRERRPDLALVIDGDGDVSPIYSRLRDDEELGSVPIVVSVEPERIALSEEVLGVHELIVSPFTSAELSARIARARRVVRGVQEHEIFRDDGLELHLAAHEARLDGGPVDFTFMEYELLKHLVTHPGRAFTREALLRSVWGYEFFGGARTVDVHVRRVRVKLGDRHAPRLRTVRRVGYRWEP